VRDIAAHLLHDDPRRLSRTRDHVEGSPPEIGESLPAFLNRANERWLEETRFLSSRVLVDPLAHTGNLIHQMWADSNLDELGEGVWWAGVEAAPVWLDVARDYSEDWTHHQQIRDDVNRPGLRSSEFLDPVLDTFMCALPKTYEALEGDAGTTVVVALNANARSPGRWLLTAVVVRRCIRVPGTLLLRRR
jgi:hypothetical protein